MTTPHCANAPEHTPPRRRFMAVLGGVGVVAATAPMAACSTSYPGPAVLPWQTAGREADLRRFMLGHALLAPNPHNRQPWVADLREAGEITLVCDGDRLLPETDPFGRQILIGCGAFIELAVLAAAERGHAVSVQAFPKGAPADDRLPAGTVVARLVLGAPGSAVRDPLFAQITRRHTHKGAYEPARALPAGLAHQWDATARLQGLQAGVVTDASRTTALRIVARRAWEQELLTPRTWLESARLLRIGPRAIEQHRDGIPIMGAMPRLAHAVGAFDPMEVPLRGNSNFARVMERWAPFETGSGFVWLASAGNTRAQQLAAGRAHVRAHLQATALGVEMHPLSQALQEFDEVRAERVALHEALGLDLRQSTLQMFSRVGFAAAPAVATPRRGVGDLIRA